MTLVLAGITSPAAAQSAVPDLTVGYQYQWVPAGQIPIGFTVDISAPLTDVVSLVGQFDWSNKSKPLPQLSTTQTVYMLGGGIRLNGTGTVRPFVQFLAGVTRNNSHTTFSNNNSPNVAGRTVDNGATLATVQTGGGLAVSLSEKVSAVWEIDFRPYIHNSSTVSASARTVAGIRINLR